MCASERLFSLKRCAALFPCFIRARSMNEDKSRPNKEKRRSQKAQENTDEENEIVREVVSIGTSGAKSTHTRHRQTRKTIWTKRANIIRALQEERQRQANIDLKVLCVVVHVGVSQIYTKVFQASNHQ